MQSFRVDRNILFVILLRYGLLGDGINLAARIQSINKRYNTDVIVSEDTYHSGGLQTAFHARPLELVAVKGKVKGITIYEVLCNKVEVVEEKQGKFFKAIAEICEEQHAGFNAYLKADFHTAIQHMDKVREHISQNRI